MFKIPKKLVFRIEVTLVETQFDDETTTEAHVADDGPLQERAASPQAKGAATHTGDGDLGPSKHCPTPELNGALSAPLPPAGSRSRYRGPMYRVNTEAQPPRRGSTNWEVWERALKLPPPFPRDQFESVVGPAMRYDATTGTFSIATNFRDLRQAQQAYFSEFRKRRFIVEAE